MKSKRSQLVTLGILLVLTLLVLLGHQSFFDWLRLRNYTAPAAVAALASEDGMTDKARHLFYVNHPAITSGKDFTENCPVGTEKTVVLGCYIGNDRGIYVYAIADERLNGVEQVTAAHEMLHAAYRRLSSSERSKVDAMLTDYYEHGLTDERIKDTIAAYKKSEPNDVVNEMHSVFGTEVVNLPAPLEQYYAQYFSDRSKVTSFTANYQNVFTSRQAQVAAYDSQLNSLKQQIDASSAQVEQEKASLDSQNRQLQAYRSSGQISLYNASVPSYNQAVNAYNAKLSTTKTLINQYNDIVAARNAIALEEQELVGELSANSLPKSN
jgi:hypothetical protein